MQSTPPGGAILITGAYGTGKSSVGAEIADIIEGGRHQLRRHRRPLLRPRRHGFERADVDAMHDILPVPMRVVRLTLSLDEITRRLSADPTSGRKDDSQKRHARSRTMRALVSRP